MDDTYLMLVDGKVTAVDFGPVLRRHRAAHAEARAAAVGQLADALAVESLDVMELCDTSGLPESGVDAATYVALTLAQIEQDGPQALPWAGIARGRFSSCWRLAGTHAGNCR